MAYTVCIHGIITWYLVVDNQSFVVGRNIVLIIFILLLFLCTVEKKNRINISFHLFFIPFGLSIYYRTLLLP